MEHGQKAGSTEDEVKTEQEHIDMTTPRPQEDDNSIQAPPEHEAGFKQKLRVRGLLSGYFLVSGGIFLLSLAVYIVSRLSPGFAEFWTRYPATWIRAGLTFVTSFFSFSLTELLILCLPVFLIVYVVLSWRAIGKQVDKYEHYRWNLPPIAAIFIIASLFFASFAPGYFRYPLDKNIGITKQDVSAEELYDTAVLVSDLLAPHIDEVDYRYDGSSVLPYSYDTLVEKLNAAYKCYAKDADYISGYGSTPKPIALSEPFTYTHVSGVYSFITGEANINTNYPDFILPFTMTHEMAHQRGISREEEANFVAFLVCMESDDPYIKYSAYVSIQNYLMNSLYKADKDLYSLFYKNHYSQKVRGEYTAFSLFFDKYRSSTTSKVTGTLNNALLTSQGQKEGIRSYGLVVDLAVAYYKSHFERPYLQ